MAILLVLAAFATVHGPTVVRNLPKRHWEDGRHFRRDRELIHSLADCFTRPSAWPGGAEATYRPLLNVYYFAGSSLFDNRLEVYHAIDAAVFVLNGVLLFLVCRPLLPGLSSLVPPVLFVSRRAHLQVVTYTSEFDALSYVTFVLIGLSLFVNSRGTAPEGRTRRGREALAAATFGLALLCKEAAVVFPGLLAAYGWLFDRARAWRRDLAGWVVVTAWVVIYRHAIRALYAAGTPGFAFDFRPLGVLSRYAAYLLCFPNVLVPAIDPEKAGWAMPPRVTAWAETAPAIILVACLVVAEAAVLWWVRFRPASVGESTRVAAYGFAWFLVATAPYAVLTDRLFMRYAYFGHAGLSVAAGAAIAAVVALGSRRLSGRADRPPQRAHAETSASALRRTIPAELRIW